MLAPRGCILFLLLAACSAAHDPPPGGRLVVALTVDWEGAYIDQEALDSLATLREGLGRRVPFTHFVSAGYLTRPRPDPMAVPTLLALAGDGDEIAMHLHAWTSLASAAHVEPRLSPSFLSGTDHLSEVEGAGLGFDVDLDTYEVSELRAMLRTSRDLLEGSGLHVSRSFRAGAYLGSSKMMRALQGENYELDSSSIDHRQLQSAGRLASRVREIWPTTQATDQPYVHTSGLLEMPIAVVADYVGRKEIVEVFGAAAAALRRSPERNVVVVVALHQETATEFSRELGAGLAEGVGLVTAPVVFTTIEKAAALSPGSR